MNSYLWIFAVLVIFLTTTSTYETDYETHEDVDEDDDENSDVEDDSPRVDYTKYYNGNNNNARSIDRSSTDNVENPESTGFVNPQNFIALASQFNGFANNNQPFGLTGNAPAFGLSTNNVQQLHYPNGNNQNGFTPFQQPFNHPSEIFSNQKNQAQNHLEPFRDYNKPGPSYVSHKVAPTETSSKKLKKSKIEEESDEDERPKVTKKTTEKGKYDKNEGYPIKLKTLGATPEYYPTNEKNRYLDPYQKYSFQNLASTYPTINPKPILTPQDYGINHPANQPNNFFKPFSGKIHRPEDAEEVPRRICHKIEKEYDPSEDLDAKEPMTCFICKDFSTGATYERCAYTKEPQTVYVNGNGSRYKRAADRRSKSKKREYGYDEDAYDLSPFKVNHGKKKSKKPGRDYEDDEAHDYESESSEPYEDFSYDPSFHDEINYSEQQSAELKKNPENCDAVIRDGQECMVCKDPKTGGSYESCSYTSEPNDKKYGYFKESKFDSNDDKPNEEEEESGESTENQEKSTPRKASRNSAKKNKKEETKKEEDVVCRDEYRGKLVCEVCRNVHTNAKSEHCTLKKATIQDDSEEEHDESESKPKETKTRQQKNRRRKSSGRKEKLARRRYDDDEAESQRISQKKRVEGQINDQEANQATDQAETPDERETYYENHKRDHKNEPYSKYFGQLFPEYKDIHENDKEATNTQPRRAKYEEKNFDETFFKDDSKESVEDVLAEFMKKDRSNCTSKTKGHLTCFLCEDEHGMKNEECAYVTETQPKESLKGYHTVKQYNTTVPKYGQSRAPESQEPSSNQESVNTRPVVYEEEDSNEGESVLTPVLVGGSVLDVKPNQTEANIRVKKFALFGNTKSNLKNTEKIKRAQPRPTSWYGLDHDFDYSPSVKRERKRQKPRESDSSSFEDEDHDEEDIHHGFLEDEDKNQRKNNRAKRDYFDDDEEEKRSNGDDESEEEEEERPRRKSNGKNQRQNTTEETVDLPTPEEFDVDGPDGAFASELRPVYDKKLGITLPLFMLEKSEHERSYEESVANG